MSRIRQALIASLFGAIVAGGALAPVASAAPATAKAVKATASLTLPNIFVVSGNALTVPGRPLSVVGTVRPFAPEQKVRVRSYLGSKLFKTDVLRVRPSANGRYGTFTERLKTPGAGLVTVKVGHSRTGAMQGFLALRRYQSVAPTASFGATGRFVQLIQQRLAFLHFYIPQTGVYDAGTGLALDAYHRLLGWGTYQTLDGKTVSYLLNGWGQFKVRFPNHGRHAEGDLSDQLLALIDGSNVQYIFPISSGKPSTPTVLGDYKIYSRGPGYLPDGMYYSSFFTGGYAIHGYNPAPDYPASHGCMRLPIVDAIFTYNWLNYDDWVDTYYT
jgi:hypothetical protein